MSAAVSEPTRVRGLDGVWSARGARRRPRSCGCSPRSCSATRPTAAGCTCGRRGAAPTGGWSRSGATRSRSRATPTRSWPRRWSGTRAGSRCSPGVLPRSEPRPDNRAVGEGALLWADVDEPDALAKLEAFCSEHPAHYLAASGGGGRHAAWLLDDAASRRRARGRLPAAGRRGRRRPRRLPPGRQPAAARHPQRQARSRRLPASGRRPRASGLPAGGVRGRACRKPPALSWRGRERRWEAGGGRRAPWRGDDPLARIPPPVYVAALCGVAVPEGGGAISCPLPGHEDSHPVIHGLRRARARLALLLAPRRVGRRADLRPGVRARRRPGRGRSARRRVPRGEAPGGRAASAYGWLEPPVICTFAFASKQQRRTCSVGRLESPRTRACVIAGRRYSPRGRSSPMPGPSKRGPPSSACRSSSAVSSNDGPAGRGTIAVTGSPNPLIRPIRSRRIHFEVRLGRVEMTISLKLLLAHRPARWLRMRSGPTNKPLGPGALPRRISEREGGVERPVGRLAVGDVRDEHARIRTARLARVA